MEEPTKEDVTYFGRTDFRDAKRLFGIKRRDRRQHMYLIGKTGVGKSSLLHNLITQDIANKEGLCVVDPHGDLVESLLEKIPDERVDDVVYFNPADTDFNIGFNVLELPDSKYKHLAASGLMAIFTKMWANVWSARMEYILNNAILALLDTPGSTLLGVNRILVDKDYRQEIVNNIKDPVVRAFWIHEYEEWRDQFRNEAIAPIQNKVGQFLSTSLVRNIVGQKKSTMNIFDIMNEGKILLINVSKGTIGEDNSALLGGMLITKIQLAAMERVRIQEDERVDFYLYVDEFQNFATDSFASVLSEARKYRLNLILAHQYVGQLVTDVSTKVRDAIFGNAGTMVVFRVGAADAEFLENEFEPEFNPQDLVNLPNYCVYLKLMVNGVTSRPFSATTLPEFKVPSTAETRERIIENSRRKYARPSRVVEKEIENWAGSASGKNDVPVKVDAKCHSCGEMTTVNFEPEEGRAIYCRDCLGKIRDGKLKPVLSEKDFVARPRSKYFAKLSDIGIEIAEEPKEEKRESFVRRGNDVKNNAINNRENEKRDYKRERVDNKRAFNSNKERQNFNSESKQVSSYKRPSVLGRLEEKYSSSIEESSVSDSRSKEEISLSALKPVRNDRTIRTKKSVDVAGLRSALKEALTKE
jgi:CxxC-x17-CxxC domain-containing protein